MLLAGAAAAAGCTVGLVLLNGGASSPLVPLWLALGASRALPNGLAGIGAADTSHAVAGPHLIGGGVRSASLLGAALAILVLCAALGRAHRATVSALEEQVATDSLTGVRNRFALDRQIDEFLGVPHPRGALVFIDLDGFREINRSRGDLESLLAPDNQLATPSYNRALLVVGSSETAGSLQQRFARNPNAMAAAVRDQEGRVVGLITRNRLLVTLGVRFGFALYGDRPALTVADLDFMSVAPGTNRDEVVALAMAREEARRYDPILFLDAGGHLLGKLTIQELLEPGIGAGSTQPLVHPQAPRPELGRDCGVGEAWAPRRARAPRRQPLSRPRGEPAAPRFPPR